MNNVDGGVGQDRVLTALLPADLFYSGCLPGLLAGATERTPEWPLGVQNGAFERTH